MEILNKIKNKSLFGFALALFLSVIFIPAVEIPFVGNSSYISFSDYGLVIGFLLASLAFIGAIANEKWHVQSLKGIIALLWVFFLFELISGLMNFKEMFGNYNITSVLQLGAYISIVLFVLVTFKVLKFKPLKTELETIEN